MAGESVDLRSARTHARALAYPYCQFAIFNKLKTPFASSVYTPSATVQVNLIELQCLQWVAYVLHTNERYIYIYVSVSVWNASMLHIFAYSVLQFPKHTRRVTRYTLHTIARASLFRINVHHLNWNRWFISQSRCIGKRTTALDFIVN